MATTPVTARPVVYPKIDEVRELSIAGIRQRAARWMRLCVSALMETPQESVSVQVRPVRDARNAADGSDVNDARDAREAGDDRSTWDIWDIGHSVRSRHRGHWTQWRLRTWTQWSFSQDSQADCGDIQSTSVDTVESSSHNHSGGTSVIITTQWRNLSRNSGDIQWTQWRSFS